MKTVTGLVVLLASCLGMSHFRYEAGKMFEKAYRYIETSQILESYCREFFELGLEQCVMAVADSTVFMEYSMYAGERAAEAEGRDELAVVESVMRRDREREQSFEPIPVGRMLDINANPRNAPLGLFFANPLENALLARVLGNFDEGKSYRELTQFNTGVTFLFFFDNEGRITRVVEGVTHYD